MALADQAVTVHIADVNGVHLVDAGVGQRRAPGLHGQSAQGDVPVLANRRLAHSQNSYFTHN